jgi:cell division transport system ATP-binding protein
VVEFKDVTKKYQNGTAALKSVNLSINKGDFAFIVGPSGSGKSTLLKLILKEEDCTEGTVLVNGYSINTMTRKEVPYLRRSLGTVFQDFRLLPNKTVYENVAFAMHITEALPKEIRRQVPMVLALVGLSKKANAFPGQLSGGEQQRVAVARALVNNPSLLIADEPTGNLDPETSWDIMKLLSDINNRGTTVIVATHEKSIVDTMKKRVIAINQGEIVRDQQKGLYGNEDKNGKLHS